MVIGECGEFCGQMRSFRIGQMGSFYLKRGGKSLPRDGFLRGKKRTGSRYNDAAEVYNAKAILTETFSRIVIMIHEEKVCMTLFIPRIIISRDRPHA